MTKRIFFFMVCFYMTIAAAVPPQKSFDGAWFGGFEIDGKWHPAYAQFKTEKESIKIAMSAPSQQINAEDGTQVQDTYIRFSLTGQSGVFSFIGQVKDEVISGEVKYNGKSGPFALYRTFAAKTTACGKYDRIYKE